MIRCKGQKGQNAELSTNRHKLSSAQDCATTCCRQFKFRICADSKMSLNFSLNGEKVSIPLAEVDPGMTLNDYIRQETRFKGTKKACGEGGCGSCAVTISSMFQGKQVSYAVNSCLKPLAAMDSLAVTTIEGLSRCTASTFSGSFETAPPSVMHNLHPVTERFSARSSLQCGFCTPGMVMAAYAQLRNSVAEDGQVTVSAETMESCIDGNLCRCTGYRPILEACRSFALDTTESSPPSSSYSDSGKDLGIKVGPHSSAQYDPPFPEFLTQYTRNTLALKHAPSGKVWCRPTSLAEAFEFWEHNPSAKLVAGCTSWGIYKDDSPFESPCVLDIHQIAELSITKIDQNGIDVGAGCTLTHFIDLVKQHRESFAGGDRTGANIHDPLIRHIQRIAGTMVRNTATIAGNLAITKYKGFASDLATLLLGLSATLQLVSKDGHTRMALADYLSSNAGQVHPHCLDMHAEGNGLPTQRNLQLRRTESAFSPCTCRKGA